MESGKKRNIVICGYPKSGNTWVTRLVAELVQCPVRGFWQSSHNEIAKEGANRISGYACHKSHHQIQELEAFDEQPWKVIYVIRDPRDIVCSGMRYFFPGYRSTKDGQLVRSLIPDFIRYRLGGSGMMRKAMVRAILEGDHDVHHWCRISWKEHVIPYLEHPHILKVKYKDLLDSPATQCLEILRHLGMERSPEEIQNAVSAQSFEAVRDKFRKQGNRSKVKFLRKGRAGNWRNQLTSVEKELFDNVLGDLLEHLGYQTKPELTEAIDI